MAACLSRLDRPGGLDGQAAVELHRVQGGEAHQIRLGRGPVAASPRPRSRPVRPAWFHRRAAKRRPRWPSRAGAHCVGSFALPSIVLGPVLLSEFWRLARVRDSLEAIVVRLRSGKRTRSGSSGNLPARTDRARAGPHWPITKNIRIGREKYRTNREIWGNFDRDRRSAGLIDLQVVRFFIASLVARPSRASPGDGDAGHARDGRASQRAAPNRRGSSDKMPPARSESPQGWRAGGSPLAVANDLPGRERPWYCGVSWFRQLDGSDDREPTR